MDTDTDTETDEEEPDDGIEMDEGLAETYRHMLAAFTDGNNPPLVPCWGGAEDVFLRSSLGGGHYMLG